MHSTPLTIFYLYSSDKVVGSFLSSSMLSPVVGKKKLSKASGVEATKGEAITEATESLSERFLSHTVPGSDSSATSSHYSARSSQDQSNLFIPTTPILSSTHGSDSTTRSSRAQSILFSPTTPIFRKLRDVRSGPLSSGVDMNTGT